MIQLELLELNAIQLPNSVMTVTSTEDIIIMPEVKLIKLRNGESLISLCEWGEDDDSQILTLYNPFKLVFKEMELMGMPKTPVLMEEWLPHQIALEQTCQIFDEDILTMVDVNKRFSDGYQKAVLKKVQIDELVRRGNFPSGLGLSDDMLMSESESDELDDEEFAEKLAEKLKKLRDDYN